MKKVLVVNSSLRLAESHSRQLVEKIVGRIEKQLPAVAVTERDVAQFPIPHFGADTYQGFAGEQNHLAREAEALSTQLIEEVKANDILVIGAPVYNFMIPSTLKSWIDYITRAGVTFNYTEQGPQGYLTGKKVVVVLASGGGQVDAIEQQLAMVLSMVGLTDVTFIHAAGLDMPDSGGSLDKIHSKIEQLSLSDAA
ncbi:FMN-dependent NADH-azoreductase [Photobacterium sanctipauli]|uniref:FMN dependent NADH:quinone oxidoreductase n=1 Tax=Photobacterium sanctipauli TaxID=1342794 RepID=A0A2T3NWZ7_9GAMM|nr:NAD(P)H-dependent oxidoreductase [Photobacterium sanctipauli]PSW20823.1 FMN-dependent NADH-azoreductase [Photobacterium sanctipauli]